MPVTVPYDSTLLTSSFPLSEGTAFEFALAKIRNPVDEVREALEAQIHILRSLVMTRNEVAVLGVPVGELQLQIDAALKSIPELEAAYTTAKVKAGQEVATLRAEPHYRAPEYAKRVDQLHAYIEDRDRHVHLLRSTIDYLLP